MATAILSVAVDAAIRRGIGIGMVAAVAAPLLLSVAWMLAGVSRRVREL